ncbi:helix-turn-helix domain-containing protein [Clostridioides sp. GD02377]|uniref:helix-turn-helix domain-containing protein n=1 Tax=unclassified Clostridioides TaxID=2635829 RepID=UPI0038A40FF6
MEYFSESNNEVQKFDWGEVTWIHEPSKTQFNRLSAGIVRFFPKNCQEKHFHLSEEQLLYVIQGEGLQVIDGKKVNIKEKSIVYCPPYSEHEIINTGKIDLVILITYVPHKFSSLKQLPIVFSENTIQELINVNIIENIANQISNILKLRISVYDSKHKEIFDTKKETRFCDICKSIKVCNRKLDKSINGDNFEKMYECEYGISSLEIPIVLEENIVGFIECGNFIIYKSSDTDKNLSKLSSSSDIDVKYISKIYNELSLIPKSRLYVLKENLLMMSEFIQEIAKRNFFENQLSIKDEEILKNRKENIKLEEALKKANIKLLEEKYIINPIDLFNNVLREYPFELELSIEKEIKEMNLEGIYNLIDANKLMYNDVRDIIQEMIFVLSRTVLRDLEDLKLISYLRNKYNKKISLTNSNEDLWDILLQFSEECIDKNREFWKQDKRDLIENVNEYIQKYYKDNINLNSIAKVFFISPNYLSSIFNEKNQVSITEYINLLRIEESKKYLLNINMSISEVCKKVGFNNSSYFSQIFKKFNNMSPNEYRKNMLDDRD